MSRPLKLLGLYFFCIAIFSSSWVAIHSQVAASGPAWPLAERFFLGSAMLLLFCALKGIPLNVSANTHLRLAALGLMMFSVNFLAVYAAAQYLASGLNALICAMVVFFNILNSALFLKQPVTKTLLFSAALGFSGLAATLFPNFSAISPDFFQANFIGALLGLAGAYITSCGQIFTIQLKKSALHPIAMNGWAMLYGSLMTAAIAFLMEGMPSIPTDTNYYLSMAYLALVPTAMGFVLYVQLLRTIGAQRAGYIFILVPIFALLISTIFENYQWHPASLVGLSLVVMGYVCSILDLKTVKAYFYKTSF